MNKALILLVFCLLQVTEVYGQFLPKEGRELHYRIIGFSFPKTNGKKKCTLQIASGSHFTADSFDQHIITEVTTNDARIVAEVPSFGATYTWRVVYSGNNDDGRTTFHHFRTGTMEMVDSAKTRVRILHKPGSPIDAYVFMDGNKALYDMEGKPVWYFPIIDNRVSHKGQITDLKMTPQGTITFLYNDQRAYGITYDGAILWKGEFNDIYAEDTHYHHEFTRLPNGHYMVLGTEEAFWKPHTAGGNGKQPLYDIAFLGKDGRKPEGMDSTFPFTIVYEYDEKGKRVWEWKFADYFPTSDLYYRGPANEKYSFDPHPNAFWFDDDKQVLYLGCRNNNRIVKIDYASRKVIKILGEVYDGKDADTANTLFSGQHAIRVIEDGSLAIYNNNVGTTNGLPTVVVCKQDSKSQFGLKKVWEYTCDVSDMITPKRILKGYTRGGNVIELADGSFFVSMSRPYCKMFIVNRQKQVLWGALAEYYDDVKKLWVLIPQYRGSIVPGRAALEKMIWNDEAK